MDARFLWRALRSRYRDNRTELQAIAKNIRPNDLVCDIGANKGSYLYWLSRWTPRGRVVAFEPQPKLAAYLRRAGARSNLKNITVEQKGVFSKTGERSLYLPALNSPGATLRDEGDLTTMDRITVPVVSLDDYFRNSELPDILKIDVEGAELEVFRGADRILTERKPFILFECEQRHLQTGTIFDTFNFLLSKGYSGKFITGNALAPLAHFSIELHQRDVGDRFWNEAGYCNNFVFSAS